MREAMGMNWEMGYDPAESMPYVREYMKALVVEEVPGQEDVSDSLITRAHLDVNTRERGGIGYALLLPEGGAGTLFFSSNKGTVSVAWQFLLPSRVEAVYIDGVATPMVVDGGELEWEPDPVRRMLALEHGLAEVPSLPGWLAGALCSADDRATGQLVVDTFPERIERRYELIDAALARMPIYDPYSPMHRLQNFANQTEFEANLSQELAQQQPAGMLQLFDALSVRLPIQSLGEWANEHWVRLAEPSVN